MAGHRLPTLVLHFITQNVPGETSYITVTRSYAINCLRPLSTCTKHRYTNSVQLAKNMPIKIYCVLCVPPSPDKSELEVLI